MPKDFQISTWVDRIKMNRKMKHIEVEIFFLLRYV